MIENCIEWLTNHNVITVSFSQKRFVNAVRKYAEVDSRVEIVEENSDGSICAHLPLDYLALRPKRQMSEEQRQANAERLRKMREGQS